MSAVQQITVQISMQPFGWMLMQKRVRKKKKEEEQLLIPEIVITPEEMEQIGDPDVLLTNPFQLENLLEEHDALSLFKHHH